MEKKTLNEIDLKGSIKIASSETATVYKLRNGRILKIYNAGVVEIQKMIDIDLEKKVLSAKPIENSPEILVPITAVYTNDRRFCGYIMPNARGVDYNEFDNQLTIEQRQDLTEYAELHYKLENVLRRNQNIVFPDFCTCDNIFIDQENNFQFIDYDGLQVGKHKSISISTSLGDCIKLINNPKYFTKEQLFTKELDKKSSIILFYLTAFNIDLNKVGAYNPFSRKSITLDDIFECLNLNDPDICHKTYKIFNDKEQNEYLGEDLLNFADKYDLNILTYNNNMYIKRLKKKK